MSLFHDSALIGASGQSAGGAGYSISRSIRLNAPDSAYLSRTPASAGNRKTWTWAGWVKRSALGTEQAIFTAWSDDSNRTIIRFNSSDAIQFLYQSGGTFYGLTTNQVFRDSSAWYHLIFVLDTSNSTSTNRSKIYVNGSQVDDSNLTAFSSGKYPPQNTDYQVNGALQHLIGARTETGSLTNTYGNFYLADCFLIDSQALDPTAFGEFSATTGVWVSKAYSGGSYGTNGFHLDFADNSAATAATLGTDTSGNGNNWTPVNLSVAPTNINTSQKWSGLLSASGGSGFTNQGAGGFAGYDDANNYTYVSGANSGTNYTITLTPPSTISFTTSLVVRVESGVGQVTINGGTTWVSDTGGLVTFTGPGSFSAITVRDSRGQYGGEFHSVKVDGVLLVDPGALSYVDSLIDVPTNGSEVDTGLGNQVRGNYCTLNPLLKGANTTLSDGNLQLAITNESGPQACGTIGMVYGGGNFYCEFTQTVAGSNSNMVGLIEQGASFANNYIGADAKGWGYFGSNGNKYNNASASSYGSAWGVNDVIGIAYKGSTGELFFYKNGVVQNSGTAAFTGLTSGPYFFAAGNGLGGTGVFNFGQRPFAYTAPSGFKALCTANLPAPTIEQPSTVMDVKLYTGNGSTQTISGLGFSPDLVWIKARNQAYGHALMDVIRGASARLFSELTDAEDSTGTLTAFNTDGFSVSTAGGSSDRTNTSSATYAAWCWDAGSSTVTDNTGSMQSTRRTNASAGFSVATWTGTGANATIGHGLGVSPAFIIAKARTAAEHWQVGHTSIGWGARLFLSTTASIDTTSAAWNNTAPTSTVFSVGNSGNINNNGTNYVAYCFAPVNSYSAFGSYTGNGSSTDNTFVYTGMRPRFVLLKRSDSTGNWVIWDAARNVYNVANSILLPNTSAAEYSPDAKIDILSNGFKIRDNSSDSGTNGATYIYAAFAESPFAANNRAR